MVFYHGTNIRDGESILQDGFLFSIAFLRLRDELRKRQFSEENILSMFRELGEILPVEFNRDFDRERVLSEVKGYCLNREFNFDLYFRPGAKFPVFEALLDRRTGIHFFDDERGYYHARETALHKCLSISDEKRWEHPEGIVFEADFPHTRNLPVFCRQIPLSKVRMIHLLYENYETVQRISSLARTSTSSEALLTAATTKS